MFGENVKKTIKEIEKLPSAKIIEKTEEVFSFELGTMKKTLRYHRDLSEKMQKKFENIDFVEEIQVIIDRYEETNYTIFYKNGLEKIITICVATYPKFEIISGGNLEYGEERIREFFIEKIKELPKYRLYALTND